MRYEINKSILSPSRARLLELMQRLNFGFVESLAFRDGQPVFSPPPRLVREVKFGADNGPRPEADQRDFTLKARVLDLFAHLEALGSGVIRRLEVKHGLPFLMTVEEVIA